MFLTFALLKLHWSGVKVCGGKGGTGSRSVWRHRECVEEQGVCGGGWNVWKCVEVHGWVEVHGLVEANELVELSGLVEVSGSKGGGLKGSLWKC